MDVFCRPQKVSQNLSLLPQLQKSTSISPLILSSVRLSVEGTHQKAFMHWLQLQYVAFCFLRSFLSIYVWKVEHGFLAHMKGTFVVPPQINHKNCWGPLKDFFNNIDKVKEECWTAILQFHGVDKGGISDTSSDHLHEQSMISAFCAGMYVSSSPIKPWNLHFFNAKCFSVNSSLLPSFSISIFYVFEVISHISLIYSYIPVLHVSVP